MKKWTVHGVAEVSISIDVEAETEDEAIETAYASFDGLTDYAHRGGGGLVGSYQLGTTVEASDAFDFTQACAQEEE